MSVEYSVYIVDWDSFAQETRRRLEAGETDEFYEYIWDSSLDQPDFHYDNEYGCGMDSIWIYDCFRQSLPEDQARRLDSFLGTIFSDQMDRTRQSPLFDPSQLNCFDIENGEAAMDGLCFMLSPASIVRLANTWDGIHPRILREHANQNWPGGSNRFKNADEFVDYLTVWGELFCSLRNGKNGLVMYVA